MAETWATIVPSGDHGTRDWATSHVVTATDLDTEIRDRMDWLYGALTGGPVDVAERRAWHLAGVAAPAVNQSARATRVSGTVAEFTSGTHPLLSTFQVDQLSITAGAAATTTAANLHVQTEPTGATNNYAVYVAGGKTRLIGDLIVNAGIVINNTAAAVSGTDKGLEVVKSDLTAVSAYGIMSRPSSTGTQATGLTGVYSRPDKTSGATTLAIGFHAGNPVISAGSYATYYGVLIDDITAVITNKWGFYAVGAINSRLSDVGGKVFIGDTTDAGVTTGLIINQGTADDAILSGKSSEVAHGFTDFAETDTYFQVGKAAGTDGGARIDGFTDVSVGVLIAASVNTQVTGAKSDASVAAVQLAARDRSGTAGASMGTDSNLVGIYDNTTARFIFAADSNFHSDSGNLPVSWDDEDDLGLLNTFQYHVSAERERIPDAFRRWIRDDPGRLVELGILSPSVDGKAPWVNWTYVWMLLCGTVRQEGLRVRQLEEKVAKLERALPAGSGA